VAAGLRGKHLVDIACGPTHSAALTSTGQLYVWGSSCAGSSPSSSSCKVSVPLLISPGSSRFVQVACGSADCALLLLYSSGSSCSLSRNNFEQVNKCIISEPLFVKKFIWLTCDEHSLTPL